MTAVTWRPEPGLIWLVALALYALLLLIASLRQPSSRGGVLRAIPLYARLHTLLSRAVETDTPLHISLGSRSVAEAAPEIAQAAALTAHVARIAGAAKRPIEVTSGAPTLFVATSAVGRAAAGHAEAERGAVRHGLVGVEPLAYAVGAWEVAAQSRLAGQVCFGPFGAEGLLLQEGTRAGATSDPGLERLSGTAEIDAAALLHVTSTATALGEDVYAASAYLRQAHHRAGLALQDGARMVLLLGMVIGLGLRLAGLWGG